MFITCFYQFRLLEYPAKSDLPMHCSVNVLSEIFIINTSSQKITTGKVLYACQNQEKYSFFIFLNIFSKKQYNPDLLEVTVTEITEMTSILFSGSEVP